MKKYNVTCGAVSADMITDKEPWEIIPDNPIGGPVEASSPDEAIRQVMDWLIAETVNSYSRLYKEELSPVKVFRPGNLMVIYREPDGSILYGDAFFTAKEV